MRVETGGIGSGTAEGKKQILSMRAKLCQAEPNKKPLREGATRINL